MQFTLICYDYCWPLCRVMRCETRQETEKKATRLVAEETHDGDKQSQHLSINVTERDTGGQDAATEPDLQYKVLYDTFIIVCRSLQ